MRYLSAVSVNLAVSLFVRIQPLRLNPIRWTPISQIHFRLVLLPALYRRCAERVRVSENASPPHSHLSHIQNGAVQFGALSAVRRGERQSHDGCGLSPASCPHLVAQYYSESVSSVWKLRACGVSSSWFILSRFVRVLWNRCVSFARDIARLGYPC
jgi:hypothetical protein